MKTEYTDEKVVDARYAGGRLDVVSVHSDYVMFRRANYGGAHDSIIRLEADRSGGLRWVEFVPPEKPKECRCG